MVMQIEILNFMVFLTGAHGFSMKLELAWLLQKLGGSQVNFLQVFTACLTVIVNIVTEQKQSAFITW